MNLTLSWIGYSWSENGSQNVQNVKQEVRSHMPSRLPSAGGVCGDITGVANLGRWRSFLRTVTV